MAVYDYFWLTKKRLYQAASFYLKLSQAIFEFLGLSWAFLECLRLCLGISVHFWLSRLSFVIFDISRTFWHIVWFDLFGIHFQLWQA